MGLGKGFSGIKAKLSLDNSEFPETEWVWLQKSEEGLKKAERENSLPLGPLIRV